VCTGLLAVIAALFIGGYAVWILVEAFDKNGSPGGGGLFLVAGLILLLLSGAVLSVGIRWSRARDTQE
jgi:hypothetical protein